MRALPRHFREVEPLYNTQQGDKQALRAWQKATKGRLLTIIAAALVGALAVLLLVVVNGLLERRDHRRQLREVDLEMAGESQPPQEDDLAGEPVDTLDWWSSASVVLLVITAVATFVMFGLGVLMVLTFM